MSAFDKMTVHFTTADGCERWDQMDEALVLSELRIPYTVYVPYAQDYTLTSVRMQYSYRKYRLDLVEPKRGLAHYVEVA
jgi:hypothetical protein